MDSEIMFICLCFLLHLLTTSNSVSQKEILEFPEEIFVVDKYLTIPLKNIKVNTNNAIMHLKFEHQSAGYCDFVVTIGQQNCTCIDTCSKTDQFNCTINIDTGPLLLIPKVIHRDNCQVPSLKLNLVTTVNSKERVDSVLDTDFALCTPVNTDMLSSKCLEKHGPSASTEYITTQRTPTLSERTDNGSQWSTSTTKTSESTSSQTTSESNPRSTATTTTDKSIMPSHTLSKSTQKSTSTKRTTTHEDITLQTTSESTQMSTSTTTDKDKTSSHTTAESIEVSAATTRFSKDSTSPQRTDKTLTTDIYQTTDTHLTPKKANHISLSQKRDKPNMALALGITISLCSAGVFIMVFLIARVMYKTRKITSIADDLAQNEERELYTSATNTAFNPCFVHIRKISESNTDDDSSESQTSSPETTERKTGRYWDRPDTSRDCCTGSCGDFSSLCSENNCVSIARPGRRGNIDVTKHRHDTNTAIYAVSYKKK